MDHTLDFDILLSLIRKQKSKNAVNEEIIDLPADFVEYIKKHHSKTEITQRTSDITEWLDKEPLIRQILETYIANIAPIGLNGKRYRILAELETSYIDLLDDILNNYDLDSLIYEIVFKLCVDGSVGILLLDLSSAQDILNNLTKLESTSSEFSVLDLSLEFDLYKQIQLENQTTVLAKTLQALRSKNHTQTKTAVVNVRDLVTRINSIKPVIVHASRIIPITVLKFNIGYLIAGNPYLEDLSAPLNKEQVTIATPHYSKTDLQTIINFLKSKNISVTQQLIKQLQESIKPHEQYTFVPAQNFEYIKLPTPYSNGLIRPFLAFLLALKTIRTALLAQVIKAQTILVIRTETSAITKSRIGEYLQDVINSFRGKLYHVPEDTPISALPNFITPLSVIITPTVNGSNIINFEQLQIPFDAELQTIYEMLRNDFLKQTGLPNIFQESLDESILTAINFTLYNKITTIQNVINRHLVKLTNKLFSLLHSSLFDIFYGMYSIELHKQYTLLLNQLSELINTLQNLQMTIKNDETIKKLLAELVGSDLVDLLDKDIFVQLKETEKNLFGSTASEENLI